MLRPYAFFLVNWTQRATFLAPYLDTLDSEEGEPGSLGTLADKLRPELELIHGYLQAVDMPVSLEMVDRMRALWRPQMSRARAAKWLGELRARIIDELKSRHFLYVDAREVPHYNEPLNGWDDVPDKFPSASYDIQEASRCLALGRTTASVIHLMRVLEIGLQTLAQEFGVKYEHSNWKTVIDQVDARIKRLEQARRRPKDWKSLRQFYSEAASEFRMFKDAWRNYAMHVHERYGEEDARAIFAGVKVFMKHLSSRLAEP